MDLFGDIVQIIPATTKKMKHNTKSRKRKQGQALEYTETFPEEATECTTNRLALSSPA